MRSAAQTPRRPFSNRGLSHPTRSTAGWARSRWINRVTLLWDTVLPAAAISRLFVIRAACPPIQRARWRARTASWKAQDRRPTLAVAVVTPATASVGLRSCAFHDAVLALHRARWIGGHAARITNSREIAAAGSTVSHSNVTRLIHRDRAHPAVLRVG